MTKRAFEEYIDMIELQLDIRLLDWQKIILQEVYDGKHMMCTGIRNGKTVLGQAVQMLNEEMNRDAGNLPKNLYELDGYTANITLCDEIKEN